MTLATQEHVRLALNQHIQTHGDRVSVLERGGIDLVLSNFSLSGVDRLSVSEVLRSRWQQFL
jgi:hypothetical protein